MSPDTKTIMHQALPSPIPFPGVASGERRAVRNANKPAGTAYSTQLDDPRWVFAMRARSVLEREYVQIQQIDSLQEQAARLGLSPMQINAIIGSIERSIQRGGFDRMAHDEIMDLPEASSDGVQELSTKARWITFSVLFVWALSIAGLMQLVR